MKTKKRSFVALMATLAVGTAAVAGFGIASMKSVNNGLFAKADTVIEDEETYTDLVIGDNALTLTANEVQNCIIRSDVDGEQAPAGWYTFTKLGAVGFANFDFVINGEIETKTLNRINTTFTVQIMSPSSTVIPAYWSANSTINFAITYSETDPNAPDVATLNVGENTVNATGEGAEYVFTSENGGSYSLSCHDKNAFIMVETVYVDPEYGDVVNYEEVPLFDAEYDQYGEIIEVKEWLTYEFTVEAGKSVKFLMSTLDWSDAQYTVTIAE